MGITKSKDAVKEPRFSNVEELLVSQLFQKISNAKKTFNKQEFSAFANTFLDEVLCEQLFELFGSFKFHNRHPDNHKHYVDYDSFTKHLAIILKGEITDHAKFLTDLLSDNPHTVNGEHLVKPLTLNGRFQGLENADLMTRRVAMFVARLVESLEKVLLLRCPRYRSWVFPSNSFSHYKLALYIMEDLLATGSNQKKHFDLQMVPSDAEISTSCLETWISKSTLYQEIFHDVFHTCFCLQDNNPTSMDDIQSSVPEVCDTDWSKVHTVLDLPSVLFLNSLLPAELKSQWQILFSNSLHGDSFTQLVKAVDGNGPTFLIVQDSEGHLFGGFASQRWRMCPKFYGDSQCCLLRLNPYFAVYPSSGTNNNFMYLNMNMHTLPNGLGMGGQMNYFGLWIDQEFDRGHSKAVPRSSTFNSPQLSKFDEFDVCVLEVWHVGPQPKRKESSHDELLEEERLDKMSVIDKDPAAKAILELIGRHPHSEGLRDGDMTADSPEDHGIVGTDDHRVISLF